MSLIVITGANRGIGLHLCEQYAKRGDSVIALCRQNSNELEALDNDYGVDIHTGIDVADDKSVADFAKGMAGGQSIDILINNAGILTSESLDDLDFDRMRRQYEVNALGPLRVTNALMRLLRPGAKVAIVSSRVGSLADNSSSGNYGYRMSKAAVNMAGKNLAIDLAPRDIAVVLLHPGYVNTGMTAGRGPTDPAVAAAGLIERIDALTMETTGTFWHAEGYELPW